jgi:hypothetical protein
MMKLIIIIKFDCPFNLVYFSVFEFVCMLLEFMFTFYIGF